MKRSVSSETARPLERPLKRSNSSLFSIATMVDFDDCNDPNLTDTSITRLMKGGEGGAKSSNGLLLVDNNEIGKEDTEEKGRCSSSLKASSFLPLDYDDAAPDDEISSSCSSSELEQDDDSNVNNVLCKSIHQENEDGVSSSRDLPQLKLMNKSCKGNGQALPAKSLGVASTIEKVESTQDNMQPITSNDNKTGVVFESGSKHFDRHNRFHKERPIRITAIQDYLAKANSTNDNEKTIFERCHLMKSHGDGEKDDDADTASDSTGKTPEELWLHDHDYLRVHLPGYMQRLDKISKCNCHNRLDIEAEQFKSIYFTTDSVREAKAAASSLCNLVSRVASGELDNGFAVIRPPGHHAEPGLSGGYCVINNVAVAAAYAREKLGMKKVLIVDWDVHHGNGTQRCFLDNPNVLYFSVHRYHHGNFFPFLQNGDAATVGKGDGEGFNINVGWNEKKMGDDEYLVVWEKLLMPVATEFNPDLVIVSAGFDAARGDMGECDITPECFARLTRRLKTLANGKIVCALEGGYVRSVLCKCVESVLGTLLDAKSNEKCEKELRSFYKNLGDNEMLDCIDSSAAKSIRDTMKAHSQYWECLG